MSQKLYQNKLVIIPTLIGSLSAMGLIYGMSTPRYAMFRLGRALDARDMRRVESIIDVKAVSEDLADGMIGEATAALNQPVDSNKTNAFKVQGLALISNMKPALEALYTKQGQELLETAVEKFSGSATSYLVSQNLTRTDNTAVLALEVPQDKMDLGLPQLEVELNKVPGTGWKVVGLSTKTIHALYEKRKLPSPIAYNQEKTFQCNQLTAIINEAVSGAKAITSNGQVSNPESMLRAAELMETAATKLEVVSLTDSTLQDYQSQFLQMYRNTSQATRTFVEAFENQDRSSAEAALTSLQQATTPEAQLVAEVNNYCAR